MPNNVFDCVDPVAAGPPLAAPLAVKAAPPLPQLPVSCDTLKGCFESLGSLGMKWLGMGGWKGACAEGRG